MPNVFFVGDVALDEYYQADYFPKIKEKIIVHPLPSQMGGSIANAACVFAAYGNQPQFLTALNSGEITQRLLRSIQEYGIDTSYMVFDDTIPDSKCIIILAEDEHTVFIPTLSLQRIELTDAALQALCDCDYIYTNLCEVRPLRHGGMDVQDVLKAIRAGGTRIWCDLDVAELSQEEQAILPYMDTILANERGEENLQRMYGATWRDVLFCMGISMIVITRAGDGVSIWQRQNKTAIHVPGHKVPVVDVTGAGDTFGGSLLHACTRSENIQLCMEFANYAAAYAVTGMGARYGASGMDAILQFIAAQGGDPTQYRIFA